MVSCPILSPVTVGGSCTASKLTLFVEYMQVRGDNSLRLYVICFSIVVEQ